MMSAASSRRNAFDKLVQENEMSSKQSSIASGGEDFRYYEELEIQYFHRQLWNQLVYRPRVESAYTDDIWDNEGMPEETEQIRKDLEDPDLIQTDPSHLEEARAGNRPTSLWFLGKQGTNPTSEQEQK